MKTGDIQVVSYSEEHAESISKDLFVGVPEEIIRDQKRSIACALRRISP